jgi:membrane-associated phospholipid phosphatase
MWIDKPIAYFVHDMFGQLEVASDFTGTPSFFSPLAILVLLVFLVRRLALRPFCKLDIVLILCDLSIILSKFLVPPLKFVFGRTWPQYHVPSLIGDGVYGFNFFQRGQEFESFPSGHMASICALTVVFWICYPRFRPLYTTGIAVMAGVLILGNYHFVGDVVAGGFVGSSTAAFMVLVCEALGRRDKAIADGFADTRDETSDGGAR